MAQVLPLALGQFKFCVLHAVLGECLADMYEPGAQLIFEASCQAGFPLIPHSAIQALDSAYAMGLRSGEVAVLNYAQEHNQIALIDKRRATGVARQLGVLVAGSGAVSVVLKNSTATATASIQPALIAWQIHVYFITCFAKTTAGRCWRANLTSSPALAICGQRCICVCAHRVASPGQLAQSRV